MNYVPFCCWISGIPRIQKTSPVGRLKLAVSLLSLQITSLINQERARLSKQRTVTLVLVVQKSESMVGVIILNPVKTERSFFLNLLCTNLPHYAKKHKLAVYLQGEGFYGGHSWSGEEEVQELLGYPLDEDSSHNLTGQRRLNYWS